MLRPAALWGCRGSPRRPPSPFPRAINNLATAALIAAYANDSAIVDESAAKTAVTEVTAE